MITVDRITIKNEAYDKRVKLTHSQKVEIRAIWSENVYRAQHGLLGEHISQRKLAKHYGVSRRTIVFTIYPERRVANYQVRLERGGHYQYYETAKNTAYKRKHREHKRQLFNEGKIGIV